ncbi:MAG TPA: segregation/condensation protein A [Gammaproteobacteria bacterium]|jgi:segregation and condensation protein A|nr:segregation/condensation protein A [Gammaproteobacteria bacterium]HIN74469.1 segregation/condensation protein A [Gammaproteobacteria bacterium]
MTESKIPHQEEIVLATVQGKEVTSLPEDLYVPPNSLKIFLDTFAGPLDLLLYLIRKQNLDVLDIDVAKITEQYISYIDLMESFEIELAGDYLVMAAYLAELKSRMLLPRPKENEEEEDPRAELMRRLQEYQRFKEAAAKIDLLPRLNRDFYLAGAKLPEFEALTPIAELPMEELTFALAEVMRRVDQSKAHLINFEQLSTRERMTEILERMRNETFIEFYSLFSSEEGRMGVVVTFLAVLELLKDSLIEIVQSEEFGPIHIRGIEEVH